MTESAEDRKIADLEREIHEKQAELARLRREAPPMPLEDYTLRGPAGARVRLSEVFGEHRDLIVIHNMGSSCPYCTLWADGFNGIVSHLENRAAFVLVSPDSPVTQAAFAEQRGWKFRMLSNGDSGFTEDMGFLREGSDGKMRPAPGVSTFRKDDDGSLTRIAHADFGPGDPFCGAWHVFSLLDGGAGEWAPRSVYS